MSVGVSHGSGNGTVVITRYGFVPWVTMTPSAVESMTCRSHSAPRSTPYSSPRDVFIAACSTFSGSTYSDVMVPGAGTGSKLASPSRSSSDEVAIHSRVDR
jgi:hypothetical protein